MFSGVFFIRMTITCSASSDNYEVCERTLENALSSVNDDYSCNAVMTAADELLSNIEKYSCLSASDEIIISIEVNSESGYVLLNFEYGGILFDPVNYNKTIDFSEKKSVSGGRGIFLTGKIMDEFSYREHNGKNIVEIIKYLN